MDAKTAVELIRESYYACSTNIGRNYRVINDILPSDREMIADFIEQQEKYAKLGQLALEAKQEWANMMCDSNGKFKMRDDECCEFEDKDVGCQWYKICRGESELISQEVK